MRPIERGEVLGIAGYEPIRERFRQRIIAEKKRRRLDVGPHVTVLFENRDTVLYQIEEMLRTERITREAAIQHEIETYNELVPRDGELSLTVMIGVADTALRDRLLVEGEGFEDHVFVEIDGKRAQARIDPARRLEGRTSAVHYMRAPLPEGGAEALRRPGCVATIVLEHPAFAARAALPRETVVALAEDLAG